MTSRSRRNLIVAIKWACYALVLLVAATLQTTPGLFVLGGVRPVFILPVCLGVAVYEGEYPGAAFGAVGGLLWDFTAGRVSGLLAIEVMFACFAAAILVELYLRVNTMNFVIINGCGGLLLLSLDFLFYYYMQGYASPASRYFSVVLPMVVFSAALSPFAMLIVQRIHRRFTRVD